MYTPKLAVWWGQWLRWCKWWSWLWQGSGWFQLICAYHKCMICSFSTAFTKHTTVISVYYILQPDMKLMVIHHISILCHYKLLSYFKAPWIPVTTFFKLCTFSCDMIRFEPLCLDHWKSLIVPWTSVPLPNPGAKLVKNVLVSFMLLPECFII